MADFYHIGLCVTLTEEEPLPAEWFPWQQEIRNVFVPVHSKRPPTVHQVDFILETIEDHLAQPRNQNGNVLVHCGGGKGRAGTVAACYLTKWGLGSLSDRIRNTLVR